jgi:hypothetical protein
LSNLQKSPIQKAVFALKNLDSELVSLIEAFKIEEEAA